MAVWAAVLIAYGVSAGIAMHSSGLNNVLPLDMAPNSVDDMYDGCKDKMSKVQSEYLKNEIYKDCNFRMAWHIAETYYNEAWGNQTRMSSTSLGKEQIMAIHVYTLKDPEIYRDFNNSVRNQGTDYNTTFSYHALHFFLTDALQKLDKSKTGAEGCVTGFRRVNMTFYQNVTNKEIRFGSFTSSSLDGYLNPGTFGEKSCFEIFTCLGANITKYSKFENETEVLIPPYEVFNVIKIERRSEQQSLPCEVVYKMKSIGTHSNFNCALVQK